MDPAIIGIKRLLSFKIGSSLMTRLMIMGVLLLNTTVVMAQEEFADESAFEPTPLSDFAPDEIRPVRGKSYDQGLTISKITVDGNKLINDQLIKDSMRIRPGSLYSKKNLGDDLRRVYDMGYFTENIKAVPVSTSQGIHLRIVVQENAPVTGVEIEGNTILEDTELQKIFAGQTGMPQNIGQLNEGIEKVEELYAEKGYILARVTDIEDEPDGTINLKVNEGKVGKIEFVGNRKTKDFVIKRAMALKEGDVYNEKLLSEDLKRIFSTQSFSDVRRVITVDPENPDEYHLTVEVDEKKTGAISVGGGLDTGTGLFGSVGYTDPNFLGRGQSVSSIAAVGSGVIGRNKSTQASARNYQFEVNWSDPSLMQTNNALSTSLYGRDFASFNVPLGVERRIGTEVVWSKPIESLKNTGFSLALGAENVSMRDYASEDDLKDTFGISSSQRDKQIEGGTFVSLSPTMAYDTRDNRLNPTSGTFATSTLTGAYGVGSSSYGTISANVRKYFKIRDGVTLALNGQAGHSLLGDIPEFNMFRMGGAYSVRGWQEGGLGVGNGMLMASAELRSKVPMLGKLKKIPVINSLEAVGFLDAGTLVGESDFNSLFDRSGTGISSGLGFRVDIPGVGPLRVDYAIPLAGGSKYTRRFNFGVGHKF